MIWAVVNEIVGAAVLNHGYQRLRRAELEAYHAAGREVFWDQTRNAYIVGPGRPRVTSTSMQTAYHCRGCGAGTEVGRTSCSYCTLPYQENHVTP